MHKRRPLEIAIVAIALLVFGCSSHKSQPVPTTEPAEAPSATETPAGPEAKIHISYAHTDDYLASLTVTKYSGADVLQTAATRNGTASIVRFAGGVFVWQFGVSKSMLTGVPVIGPAEKRYAPAEVKYGVLPGDFAEAVPENGPPEPLEADHYYIFAATRGSGSTSYEAVKVNGDGSLEAYEADPRAGASYWLCCNLAADFTLIAPPP